MNDLDSGFFSDKMQRNLENLIFSEGKITFLTKILMHAIHSPNDPKTDIYSLKMSKVETVRSPSTPSILSCDTQ